MASTPLGKPRRIHTAAADGRPLSGRRRVTTRFKVPIALKFTAVIAVLVVTSMSWLSVVARRNAAESLEREINDSGVQLVVSLAELIDPVLVANVPRLERLLASLCDRPGMEKVQDIVVYNLSESGYLARARQRTAVNVTPPEPVTYDPAQAAGVRIEEIEADGVPVRTFSTHLLGPNQPLVPREGWGSEGQGSEVRGGQGGKDLEPRVTPYAHLSVFLSAAEILQSRARLSQVLLRTSIISCLAAIVGAFLVAKILAQPIRLLARDMRQVSKGDLDHQTLVDSSDELGDLARTFNAMTSSLQAAQTAMVAQKAMEYELGLATSIQKRLLPATVPSIEGLDVAAHYVPAKEVGGDYYDFIPIDADHVGVVVADVSGKGVPGSLVMTMTRSLLRMAAAGVPAPGEVIRKLNASLGPDMTPGMFVTLAYAVIDRNTREVRMVRAGHNASIYYSARYKRALPLTPRGMAVGLDPKGKLFNSELEVQRFSIRRGDLLVLYTDGIVEAKNREGQDYGNERFVAQITAHHQEGAEALVKATLEDVQRHARGCEQSDDITLLVLKGL